jgi:hypothetical protein
LTGSVRVDHWKRNHGRNICKLVEAAAVLFDLLYRKMYYFAGACGVAYLEHLFESIAALAVKLQ